MENFIYHSPTKVIFGRGGENDAGRHIKQAGGSRVLLVTGGGSAERSGLLGRVRDSLEKEGLFSKTLTGVKPNPLLSKVHEGIDTARQNDIDFVLAVGGGSTIDTAKAISIGAVYDGDVWDFYAGRATPEKGLLHANIVTIAAAGSETSASSVITNEQGGLKYGLTCELYRPLFTIMNPELCYTLPAYQTACGAVDIVMHTLERFFSYGESRLTDRIAAAVVETAMEAAEICLKRPDDYNARGELFWAGSLSHNDLTGVGRTGSPQRAGDWSCHQLEHELSAEYGVAHGAGLAAVFGAWANYVKDVWPERFIQIGERLFGAKTPKGAIDGFLAFFKRIGMPVNIKELLGRALTDDEIKLLAEKCSRGRSRTIGVFKQLDYNDMLNIYKMA